MCPRSPCLNFGNAGETCPQAEKMFLESHRDCHTTSSKASPSLQKRFSCEVRVATRQPFGFSTGLWVLYRPGRAICWIRDPPAFGVDRVSMYTTDPPSVHVSQQLLKADFFFGSSRTWTAVRGHRKADEERTVVLHAFCGWRAARIIVSLRHATWGLFFIMAAACNSKIPLRFALARRAVFGAGPKPESNYQCALLVYGQEPGFRTTLYITACHTQHLVASFRESCGTQGANFPINAPLMPSGAKVPVVS